MDGRERTSGLRVARRHRPGGDASDSRSRPSSAAPPLPAVRSRDRPGTHRLDGCRRRTGVRGARRPCPTGRPRRGHGSSGPVLRGPTPPESFDALRRCTRRIVRIRRRVCNRRRLAPYRRAVRLRGIVVRRDAGGAAAGPRTADPVARPQRGIHRGTRRARRSPPDRRGPAQEPRRALARPAARRGALGGDRGRQRRTGAHRRTARRARRARSLGLVHGRHAPRDGGVHLARSPARTGPLPGSAVRLGARAQPSPCPRPADRRLQRPAHPAGRDRRGASRSRRGCHPAGSHRVLRDVPGGAAVARGMRSRADRLDGRVRRSGRGALPGLAHPRPDPPGGGLPAHRRGAPRRHQHGIGPAADRPHRGGR